MAFHHDTFADIRPALDKPDPEGLILYKTDAAEQGQKPMFYADSFPDALMLS